MNGNDHATHGDASNGAMIRGLAIAQDGLRLEIDNPQLHRDQANETIRSVSTRHFPTASSTR